jgi:hypothetical protein
MFYYPESLNSLRDQLEKSTRHVGEILREILDGAVRHGPCLGVVADQDGVLVLLADVLGKLLPKGSSPDLRSGLRHFSRVS